MEGRNQDPKINCRNLFKPLYQDYTAGSVKATERDTDAIADTVYWRNPRAKNIPAAAINMWAVSVLDNYSGS